MKWLGQFFKVIGAIVVGGLGLMVAIIIFSPDEKRPKYSNVSEMYPTTNLNIRKGAGTDTKILKTVKRNEMLLTSDSTLDGFRMVLNEDSTQYGWAAVKYLQSSPLSDRQLDDIKYKNDPLRIGKENVLNLVGGKVPFDKWPKWGNPITLDGTNSQYWIAYLPKANISFVSLKGADEIIFADFGEDKASNYIKNRNKKRKQKIERAFSAWDGSHIGVSSYIKERMHDPSSYEHVRTVYWDMGDHLIVKTTIRGNNMLGAKVINTYTAKVSLDGTILEIEDLNAL